MQKVSKFNIKFIILPKKSAKKENIIILVLLHVNGFSVSNMRKSFIMLYLLMLPR